MVFEMSPRLPYIKRDILGDDSIYTATNKDYYAVNSLVSEGHEEHVKEELAVFKSIESVMPKSYFQDLPDNQNSHIFIAKNECLGVQYQCNCIL
ncbi:hypothetical protein QUF65_01675 [Lysinibacillus sphaericus]|nr:hypothetical protein [Lysinibacillus sphaericus]